MLARLKTKLARRRTRRGQGITEYIIIVGLISIVVIGAVTALGDTLNKSYSGANTKMDTVQQKINGG